MIDTVDDHPLFNTSQFFIVTPMIRKLKDKIIMNLWNGTTGIAVYGDSRIGKTKALQSLKSEISNCLGESVPVKYISIAPRDKGTIAGVFKNICHSFGFKLKTRVTAEEMSNLIFHHLGELSLSNRTRQVVLIVDELQRLSADQFEAFAELYDKLASIGSNLFVLFAGNDSASSRLKKVIENNRYELIRGRFFTQEYKCYGIQSFDELCDCLSQFDINKYPENGPSYTQFFLKDVVSKNWELASLSSSIWAVYTEQFQIPLKLPSWPMQYFVSMVRLLITNLIPEYGIDDEEQLRSVIFESINVSGLVRNQVQKAS